MLTESPYVAKRVQAGVPIWDILVRGVDVGSLTDLPMDDSPMATIRYEMYGNDSVTFAAPTVMEVLEQVGNHLYSIDSDIKAESDAEYYAEVIGPMKAAEDLAEMRGWGHQNEEPFNG